MKWYIEHKREFTEVYEVEANNENEAKELVRNNWNINSPNIKRKESKESFLNVSGLYRYKK